MNRGPGKSLHEVNEHETSEQYKTQTEREEGDERQGNSSRELTETPENRKPLSTK